MLAARGAALAAHSGRGRINPALFRRRLAVLGLAGKDIRHQLGELIGVSGAFHAFRCGGILSNPGRKHADNFSGLIHQTETIWFLPWMALPHVE
ncbi:hypothetical protein SAMN05519104_7854 [Rhizobiales bacterium GAS188]|nr:hypothetical protein SAMN05519104_7854 [Rhizobiales bacterium GAS188]